MSSKARLPGSLAAAALLAAPAGCVFDEGSSFYRESAVETEIRAGEVTCADAGYPDAASLTIAPPASGTLSGDRGLTVTLETDGAFFDFSASPGVDAVIARGGDEAAIYRYAQPALTDAALSAPPRGERDARQGGRTRSLAEVTFCRAALRCTRAPAYWRSRSAYGPAEYDDAWSRLPAGADTPFFLSGRSYHDVLWTPPGEGPYYLLARRYIAAELGRLAGAESAIVAEALSDATAILEVNTPEQIAALPRSSELGAEVRGLADVLGDYLSGDIGPGRCERGAGQRADGL